MYINLCITSLDFLHKGEEDDNPMDTPVESILQVGMHNTILFSIDLL